MPLATIPPLSTARVTVRPIDRSDLLNLMEINGDDEVTRFLPYATWQTLVDASAWLERMQALVTAGTGQQLVIERACDRKTIGTVLAVYRELRSVHLVADRTH